MLRTAVCTSIADQTEGLFVEGVFGFLFGHSRQDMLQEPGISQRHSPGRYPGIDMSDFEAHGHKES